MEMQNFVAQQQLLNQTSFLLSTNQFDNSINMTRDFIGNEGNISAIPACVAGGNLAGGPGNADVSAF